MTPESLVGAFFAAVLAWVVLQFAINAVIERRHGLVDMDVPPPEPNDRAGPPEDYDG